MGAEGSIPVLAEAEAALDSWALVSGVLTWPERKVREQEMNVVLGGLLSPRVLPSISFWRLQGLGARRHEMLLCGPLRPHAPSFPPL